MASPALLRSVASDIVAGYPGHHAGLSRRISERAPLFLLVVLSLASLGSRVVWLDNPRAFIFDERYYVGSAEKIAGLTGRTDSPFAQEQPGVDPNAEHPPLGKVFIAAGIKAFGDNPLGWRVASLVFGSAAILALYWMVRSAGGSQWLGVGAAAIMAADNLFLVHGRIATLDIFVLVFMLAGTALYLRKRPVLAGVVLGIGACTKLVGLFALVGLVVFELLRWRASPDSSAPAREQPALRSRVRALAACSAVAAVSFLSLLWVLDLQYTTFTNPISHTWYMLGSAGDRSGGHNLQGVGVAPTSAPWEWLANRKPITYYGVYASRPSAQGPVPGRPAVLFQARLNPALVLLGTPAIALALVSARRRGDQVSMLGAAWSLGLFASFLAVSLTHRHNYLYYMLAVIPGVCVAEAKLLSERVIPLVLRLACSAGLVVGLLALFPFRSWGGR